MQSHPAGARRRLRPGRAHWVLSVNGNQSQLRRKLAGLPWHGIEPDDRLTRAINAAAELRHDSRDAPRRLKII